MKKKYKNHLNETHPYLLKEWDYTKNRIGPENYTAGSGEKVWWICAKGHRWEALICGRTAGRGCHYCSGHYATKENNLLVLNPELAKEWHPTKNNNLKPENFKPMSNKKVWWICAKEHEYETPISARTQGRGCPYCSGRYATKENNLLVLNPELAKEWHPTKNGDLKPENFKPFSEKKVWWICEYGHEWESTIHNRSAGNGCPRCSNFGTSFPEQAVFYYVSKVFPQAEHRKKFLFNQRTIEADIFIPQLKLAIEYDGFPFHLDKYLSEFKKYLRLKRNGINLVSIRHYKLKNDKNHPIIIQEGDGELYIEAAIKNLFIFLEKNYKIKPPVITLEKDAIKIKEQYLFLKKENSLLQKNPSLSKEWHPTKNGRLNPELFSTGSVKKVWWICPKDLDHVWKATINSRVAGNGCPFCDGKRPTKTNNLQAKNPSLSKQWHPTKNGELKPSDFTPNAHKKVWWICPEDPEHVWKAQIKSRNLNDVNCPYCSGRYATKDNNLLIKNPDLAKRWHPTKNGNLKPENFRTRSEKVVWWLCENGHEWESSISNVSLVQGCSFCSGRKASKENNLMFLKPSIVTDWNYEKNKNLLPEDYVIGSAKKVWWMCENKHERFTEIRQRVQTNGCPICKKSKNNNL